MSVIEEEDVSICYVKIEAIKATITGRQSEFKPRFVLKHNSGTEEVFEPEESADRSFLFEIETYVDVAGKNTVLQIEHRGKLKRPSRVPGHTLSFQGKTNGWFDAGFPPDCGLRVEIKYGALFPASHVADVRLRKAIEIMRSKKNMMDKLETGCKYLSLLAELGKSLAAVNSVVDAVSSISRFALERVEAVPTSFRKLSRLALELVQVMDSEREAKQVFSSKHVGEVLDQMIQLIVRTVEELITYYSQHGFKLIAKEWISPRRQNIETLQRELDAHKKSIVRAFLVEVQGGIVGIQSGVDVVMGKVANLHEEGSSAKRVAEEKENKELLNKLLSPSGSLFHGQITCLPNTRRNTLDAVEAWVDEDADGRVQDHGSRLFWLYGVAGCGKSSVAATICRKLTRKHRLAGSFFCKRDQDERRNPIRIAWSVAFSLAQSNLAFKEELLKALREPDIFVNMDFATQLDRLLLQPLLTAKVGSVSTPMVFVIDALDECDTSRRVARALAKIIESTPWILFVVTSRNLPEIQRGFASLNSLKTDYDLFQDDARYDIKAYLCHQLQSDEGLADLEPYVEEDQIRVLVDKSQGLFIWMRTVVEFLIRTEVGKLRALESILTTEKAAASESALDDIYRTVLEIAAGANHTARELVRLILGLILVTSVNEPLGPEALHAFLPPSLDALQTEFDTIIRKLSPVLILDSSTIRVYHTSFLDFASSKVRCGSLFYTDAKELNSIMAFGCFEIMQSGTRNRKRQSKKVVKTGLMFNICRFDSSYKFNSEVEDLNERISSCISKELAYSACYWFEHMLQSDITQEPGVVQFIEGLLCTPRALYWLEALAILKKLQLARSILFRLPSHPISTVSKDTKDAVVELRSFIDQFHPCISDSTPHLYLSTLPWLLPSSFLWKAWQSTFNVGMTLANPVQQQSIMLHHLSLEDHIRHVSISADDSLFATGGFEGMISIFDMQTGHQSGLPLKGHYGFISALAFSPKENILVSASELERGFRVWDVDSRIEEIEAIDDLEPICTLAFSRDGMRLATGSDEGAVRIWDTQTWTLVGSMPQTHEGEILCVALSPNGSRVASSSRDTEGDICLWDTETFSRIGDVMKRHKGDVRALIFSPDGSRLFSGGIDRTIRTWDVHTGEDCGPFQSWTSGFVESLAMTSDGSLLFSVSEDSAIDIWDPKTGQLLGTPIRRNELGDSPSFALSPDGTRGVVVSGGSDVTILDIHAALRKASSMRGHTTFVRSVAISPDGSRFASGGGDCSVFLWSPNGTLLNSEAMHHDSPVLSVQFSIDGKELVSADNGGMVRIWNVETCSIVREFKTLTGDMAYAVACSPGGTRLAVATRNMIQIWNLETGEPIGDPLQYSSSPYSRSASFSADGTRLAVGIGNTVRVWDVASGVQIGPPFECHSDTFQAVAFSPNGSMIASGGWDNSLRFWNASTGEQFLEPLMHSGAVLSVVFAPDGKTVFSGCHDTFIRAWDVASGRLIGVPLHGHTNIVHCLAVSCDGKTLLSGGYDYAVRVWDIESFFWEDVSQSKYNCKLLGPDRIPDSIPEDGWIRTSSGEPVLWIPSEFRSSVCDMSQFCISTERDLNPIRIRWDEVCAGQSWEKIRR